MSGFVEEDGNRFSQEPQAGFGQDDEAVGKESTLSEREAVFFRALNKLLTSGETGHSLLPGDDEEGKKLQLLEESLAGLENELSEDLLETMELLSQKITETKLIMDEGGTIATAGPTRLSKWWAFLKGSRKGLFFNEAREKIKAIFRPSSTVPTTEEIRRGLREVLEFYRPRLKAKPAQK